MALLNEFVALGDAQRQLKPEAGTPIVKAIDIKRAARLINQVRFRNGTKPILHSDQLSALALNHSMMMASNGRVTNSFGPGTGLRSRLSEAGLRGIAAENVGAGHSTLDSLLQDWECSRGHLANLANVKMTEFGLASAFNPLSRYRIYWTLILFRPSSH